ncbi:MAG: YbhB/YbcL family Raf kinase inhibitor-like protein [Candidatus Pacebacteria bacterium]|nr:YbhB/YbcL family Raf kinase inhibitor-like protein [Candidatus Paceibacterota bacterium]
MKKSYISLILIIVIISSIIFLLINNQNKKVNNQIKSNQGETMKLTSNAFINQGNIPTKYTCDGENINPPLQFSEIPKETKSLVLIVDDPDAPVGDWVHWLVWNIDPNTTELEENSLPGGSIQGITDFKENKYGGPCPHSGTHRYQFKLYALDTTLDLSSDTTKKVLEQTIEAHIIDQTMLEGVYKRI